MTKICVWKVVFLGNSSVGKSSIITRYTQGKFIKNNATIGAAFSSRQIVRDSEHIIQLDIWDTAGQERYRSLTQMYYRDTNVAVIVFDLSCSCDDIINQLNSWINELFKYIDGSSEIEGLTIVVVGNKLDLIEEAGQGDMIRNRVKMFIDERQGDNRRCDIRYVEVSAKTGENVVDLFEDVIIGLVPSTLFSEEDNKNDNTISLTNGEDVSDTCNC